MVIPRFGAAGAATVTASSAAAAAIATLVTVHAAWAILPGPGTWLRAAATTIAVVFAANAFPANGVAVLMKLVILSAGIVAVCFAIGGVSVREARSVLRRADSDSPGERPAE